MIPWWLQQKKIFHAQVEDEHHPWGYGPWDRVSRTEPSNYEDGNGAVDTPLLVQFLLLPPRGGVDKALYSLKVFGVMVWRKADFQGAWRVNSSQSCESCCEHKPAHVNLGDPSESMHKLLAKVAMLVFLYGAPIWADAINAGEHRRTEIILVQWKKECQCLSHCLHRDCLCAGRYIPVWDSRRWVQEGIQRYTSA